MRYHELALQRWLYGTFFVREGYPIPVVFSSPMDAFGNFDRLWQSDKNPFKYLFDLKDEKGTPLYEPYPANLRYPLISVFRRGWKYRPEQNYSIHQWRRMNWPTVSPDVKRCELGNVSVSQRPMAWDYRWQIDHYAMRPDTQAYFVEKLMRSMWITGGTPQCWVTVHYPAWGLHKIRMFIDGDIENSTLEEPEDQKHVEFRTTFTLCMEGYSVDQDIKVVPALWTLLIRGQEHSVNPDELDDAFGAQQEEDLRYMDDNVTMKARENVPSDEECQRILSPAGTYPTHDIYFSGSQQPNGYTLFGFQSTNAEDPYFLGGIVAAAAYGYGTVAHMSVHAGTFYEESFTVNAFESGSYYFPAGTVVSGGSVIDDGTTSNSFLYGALEQYVIYDYGGVYNAHQGGTYFPVIIGGGTHADAGTVTSLFQIGTYRPVIVSGGSHILTGTTVAAFGTGNYILTVINGGTVYESGSVANIFGTGTYLFVSIPAGTWYAAGSVANSFLTGTYA
jgi:hypothetical protein